MFGEAAHDADPLWRGRTVDLRLEHRHRLEKARNAVPSQLHVVVQPAADDVSVAVDKSWNDASSFNVNSLSLRHSSTDLCLIADNQKAPVADSDRASDWVLPIQGRHLGVDDNHILDRHGVILSVQPA